MAFTTCFTTDIQIMNTVVCDIKQKNENHCYFTTRNKNKIKTWEEIKWAQRRSQRLHNDSEVSKKRSPTYNFCEYFLCYKDDFQSKCRLAQPYLSRVNLPMNQEFPLLKCTRDQPTQADSPMSHPQSRRTTDSLKANTLYGGLQGKPS